MKKIKQLSIFLENKQGILYKVSNILTENDINIKGLSLSDTSEFAILRLIVNEPERTKEILNEHDFIVKIREVIGIELLDEPGGLSTNLKILDDAGIDLEYLYAFTHEKTNRAIVIMQTSNLEKAYKLFEENNTKIVSLEEIYNL